LANRERFSTAGIYAIHVPGKNAGTGGSGVRFLWVRGARQTNQLHVYLSLFVLATEHVLTVPSHQE